MPYDARRAAWFGAKTSNLKRKRRISCSPQPFFLKRLLLWAAVVLLLAGCATTIRPTDTLRWRGKDISDFIAERAHRIPDIVRRDCVKNNEVRNLYAWRIELYEIRQAYVG